LEIILGTAQLAQRYGIMSRDDDPSRRAPALLDSAARLGITTLDTAPAYGEAEVFIGRNGENFVVHTKLSTSTEPAQALDASLKRLDRDAVDVLYLHDPEVVLDAEHPQLVAAAGLVGFGARALGASIYTLPQFEAAVVDPRIGVVQLPINILDRRFSDTVLQEASDQGVRLIARSALLQGLLGDPEAARGRVPELDDVLDALRGVCSQLGRSPVEVAIQWVLARPGLSGLVIGAESVAQLEELMKAAQATPLTLEEQEIIASLPKVSENAVDPRNWHARGANEGPKGDQS
jgi:aryl-alcohol dehydrogenase-like predicted oxidoreductase